MRGAADTTLQKDMKETQPLVFQPLTSPFDFLTVENEIITHPACISKIFLDKIAFEGSDCFEKTNSHPDDYRRNQLGPDRIL